MEFNEESLEKYFKENIETLNDELKKTEKYSDIIDKKITELDRINPAVSKGSQHYLIEHLKNAIDLSSQRQSINKDLFTVKKTIIDYELKKADSSSGSSLFAELKKFIDCENNKESKVEEIIRSENLDDEIDKIISDNEDN